MAGSNITKIVLAYSGGLDTSAVSLYSPDFATFEVGQLYHQADAAGFIRLDAPRLRIRALARKQRG